jgi:hypothetical protein
MAKPLLERQASLIEYMTSGAAIFGSEADRSPVPALEGVDRTLLRVEARFSYAKRMGKITAMLPKTFELLGNAEAELVRGFVESVPPTTLNRLENARQFQRFLSAHWMRESLNPPYLCDVAACEIAFAEVDAHAAPRNACHVRQIGIRRSPAVVLRRCAYDVRPIFEGGLEYGAPIKRETSLVIASPRGANHPHVFEVVPAVFDLLAVLGDWTDPLALPADPEFAKLLADLVGRGLVEVCQ